MNKTKIMKDVFLDVLALLSCVLLIAGLVSVDKNAALLNMTYEEYRTQLTLFEIWSMRIGLLGLLIFGFANLSEAREFILGSKKQNEEKK